MAESGCFFVLTSGNKERQRNCFKPCICVATFPVLIDYKFKWESLREKCPYSGSFWPAFSRIRTKYGEILRISPYSVGIWENVDQHNSEYGQFLRSECHQLQCHQRFHKLGYCCLFLLHLFYKIASVKNWVQNYLFHFLFNWTT